MAKSQGDDAAAYRWYEEGLSLRRETGDKSGMADCLIGLAGVAAADASEMSRAAQIVGAVEMLRAAIGLELETVERQLYTHTITPAKVALGKEVFKAAFEVGRKMSLDEAIAAALAMDT